MKTIDYPAFPTTNGHPGLTKREYMLIEFTKAYASVYTDNKKAVREAFETVDCLIERLEQEENIKR